MPPEKGKRKEYLTVKDLQKLLDTCKLHLSEMDEVWPNIYIGNVSPKQADDSTHFDLDVYFQPAADFIHRALKSTNGKVLVHCIMGLSRSSTLVLAYLMIYRQLTLKRALHKLIQKRAIYPNRNFLALLLDLDLQLKRKEKRKCQNCQIL
ncbi:dual specificity protein phosphatase 26-like isoform X3 [Gouania willdenowi]|uniref:dual specificity protein phosphatase 26-like isoform X3 n=1 Tax=Gouania willdenowi TaxID=441366 RepID=UPI00105523C5|nr:dual specificity protein phosphatase 26-like isoform X3 [Gouania willdenowi]